MLFTGIFTDFNKVRELIVKETELVANPNGSTPKAISLDEMILQISSPNVMCVQYPCWNS